MTIRSSNQAVQNQMLRRGQTLATVFHVERLDGVVLRFTDLDRPVRIWEQVFSPVNLSALSAERRDAGLRADSQEAVGIVDGNVMTIPDLMGRRYRGATVKMALVDWRRPWVWHYRATKRIAQVKWDGSRWRAQLEGFGARLQRPVGGPRGGSHTVPCNYTLGDPATCKAVLTNKIVYGQSSAHTTIAGTTAAKLVQTGATWTVDEWAGYLVQLTSGDQNGQERVIESNTADTLVLRDPYDDTPAVGVTFTIYRGARISSVVTQRQKVVLHDDDIVQANFPDGYFRDGEIEWTTGANAGLVSPIVEWDSDVREATLLIPTPFDIAVDDTGVVRAGCDGLKTTCTTKFSNTDNHGGQPYSPGAANNLEQPFEP